MELSVTIIEGGMAYIKVSYIESGTVWPPCLSVSVYEAWPKENHEHASICVNTLIGQEGLISFL